MIKPITRQGRASNRTILTEPAPKEAPPHSWYLNFTEPTVSNDFRNKKGRSKTGLGCSRSSFFSQIVTYRLELFHERGHVVMHGVKHRAPERCLSNDGCRLCKLLVRCPIHLGSSSVECLAVWAFHGGGRGQRNHFPVLWWNLCLAKNIGLHYWPHLHQYVLRDTFQKTGSAAKGGFYVFNRLVVRTHC